MTNQIAPWAAIPLPLMVNLFSFLDWKDALKASTVCKDWKKIRETEEFCKTICMAIFSKRMAFLNSISPIKNYKERFSQFCNFNSLKATHIIKGVHERIIYEQSPSHKLKAHLEENQLNIWGHNLKLYHYSLNHFMSTHNEDIKDCLTIHGGIGFFSSNSCPLETYQDNRLVKMVDLKRGRIIGIIDLNDALTIEQQKISSLQCQDAIAAFVLENKLVTVTSQGILAYWDLSNIYQPKHLNSIQILQENDTKYIKRVVKYRESLIILECDCSNPYVAWIHTFCLNSHQSNRRSIYNKDTNFTEKKEVFQDLVADNSIILIVSNQQLKCYIFKEKGLKLFWRKQVQESRVIYDPDNFSSYPYILLLNGENENTETSRLKSFTVISAHNGREICTINPSKMPCQPKADCNLVKIQPKYKDKCKLAAQASYHLMANAVVRISEHQIDLWMILLGIHCTIHLPIVKYKNRSAENSLGDIGALWDGTNLIIKHPEHLAENSTLLENKLVIYQSIYSSPPEKPAFSEINKQINILPRSYFVKKGIANLAFIPWVLIKTAERIIRLISCIDYWSDTSSPELRSFKIRLIKSGRCLRQIIELPLLIVGIQLALTLGILFPEYGERVSNAFEERFASSEYGYEVTMRS